MMHLKNSNKQYGVVMILAHWIGAAIIVFMLVLGLVMTAMPDVGFSTTKIKLILLHKAIGVIALCFVALRLLWRLLNKTPALPSTMPSWQQALAQVNIIILYGLMFGLPITGWVVSSASGMPISFFGLFTLPDIVQQNQFLALAFMKIHAILAYSLIAVIALHILAALYHHFVLKDGVFLRIIKIRNYK